MNDSQGIPAAPRDRELPNHRRIREELLMKIGPEEPSASLRRRWALPLSVAAGIAAMSVTAAVVIGVQGAAKPVTTGTPLGGGSPTSATAPPSPSTTRGTGSAGGGPAPASSHPTSSPSPGALTVTSGTTTPIDAGTVSRILASCLGSGASAYNPVIAVRSSVTSQDWDGAVIAVNSAGQYVQCETKGSQGTSQDEPPTFINNRQWSPGHVIEFFDSIGSTAGQGQYLLLGAGHYSSDVAKITISYGDDPTQYPAIMAGGAFFYTAAVSTGTTGSSGLLPAPDASVHAYSASGKEIYDQ